MRIYILLSITILLLSCNRSIVSVGQRELDNAEPISQETTGDVSSHNDEVQETVANEIAEEGELVATEYPGILISEGTDLSDGAQSDNSTLVKLDSSHRVDPNTIIGKLSNNSFHSSLALMLQEEELLVLESPQGEYFYISNLFTDEVKPVSNTYSIDGRTISNEVKGFFMILNTTEEHIVIFEELDIDISSKEWDITNGFFVFNEGTGVERSFTLYDLSAGSMYTSFSLNSLFNRSGYHYNQDSELFAFSHEVVIGKAFELGIDDLSKVSTGISVIGPTNEEVLRIEPTVEGTKYITYELGETLHFDIQLDGEPFQRRSIDW